MEFFFQPADIVNQVLNFGQPSPIDIRVLGAEEAMDYQTALKIAQDLRRVPGVVDVHLFQVPSAPALRVDVDRVLARQTRHDPERRGPERAGLAQLQRGGLAQLLDQSQEPGQLSARRADPAVPGQLAGRPPALAADVHRSRRQPNAHERRRGEADAGPDDPLAGQHPPRLRRQRRRAGPRPGRRGEGHRPGPGRRSAAGGLGDQGLDGGSGPDHAGELRRTRTAGWSWPSCWSTC